MSSSEPSRYLVGPNPLYFPRVRQVSFDQLKGIYQLFGGNPERAPKAAVEPTPCVPLFVTTVFRRSKSKKNRVETRSLAGQQGWARIAYAQSPRQVESAFLFCSIFTVSDESMEFGQLAQLFDSIGTCQEIETIPRAVERRFDSDISLHVELTLESLRQSAATTRKKTGMPSDEGGRFLQQATKALKLTPLQLLSMQWMVRNID
jgi:hypothetical protein